MRTDVSSLQIFRSLTISQLALEGLSLDPSVSLRDGGVLSRIAPLRSVAGGNRVLQGAAPLSILELQH